MPKLSKEKRLQILELAKEGYTQKDMAQQLGCTSNVIKKWLERLKVDPSPLDRRGLTGKRHKKIKTTEEDDELVRRVYFQEGGCVKAKDVLWTKHGISLCLESIMSRVRPNKKKQYDQNGVLKQNKMTNKGEQQEK
jgi:transposase-like protein